MKVPITGGPASTLATGSIPIGVAVDGANVYWADFGDSTIDAVPLGGGKVTTLATGQTSCVGIAIEGPNVYWVNSGAGNLADGTIMRVGK
jgi:hypothetical protein